MLLICFGKGVFCFIKMDGFSILGLLNEQDTIVSFEDDWLTAIATDEGGKSPTFNVASHYPWSFSPI